MLLNINNQILSKRSELIKKKAKELGFDACGIAKAEYLEEEAPRLENWLNNNYQGEMHYMANHFDMRLDPRKLVDGAKSVISLSYNYFQNLDKKNDSYKIAMYAQGEDYHFVVKDKLKDLLNYIKEEFGEINGRVFVDSAPILEHAWAKKAGIGWVGKNSLTLTKQKGSFFFLSEIILDLELSYDNQINADYCGTCSKCVDACPTEAILPNKTVDGSKCISYFTIELKNEIPPEFNNKLNDWIFGCDICQNVCPWNRFSLPTHEKKFIGNPKINELTKKEWEEITEDSFKDIFKNSSVKRTKYKGLLRNINFVKNTSI